MIALSSASRIYIDSNSSIYPLEGREEIADHLRHLLNLLRNRPGVAVTSELTLAEVLVKANAGQRRDYLDLIVESGVIELFTVSRDILIETATYRRMMGTAKLADAVHVVTAVHAGCLKLLSADLRMRVPDGISLIETTTKNLVSLIEELS